MIARRSTKESPRTAIYRTVIAPLIDEADGAQTKHRKDPRFSLMSAL
jgi:hypothetical protein